MDVHVQSVSFEKENKALQAGAASAALEAGTESDPAPADDSGEETVRTDAVAEKEPVNVPEPTADIPADEIPIVKNETQNPRKKSTRNRKSASSVKDTGSEDPAEIPDKPEENGQGG